MHCHCRFGDNAPGAQGFCEYVRARPEGAILALLLHKQTGKVILAGVHATRASLLYAASLCSVSPLFSCQIVMLGSVGIELAQRWHGTAC